MVEEFVDSRMDKEVVEMAEVMITMRPDIAPIRDLLLISEVVYNIFPRNLADKATIVFINLVHSHHFLSFYRGDKNEIDLRVQLFEQLMESNVSTVAYHFKGLKLETRMYLVNWFLSVFSNCFEKDLLYRIWDNFILEGELYLFKVGIALVKYYEIELKMCTFHQGLELLKAPTETSSVLFFHILNHEIEVTEAHYDEYIEKRKHAVIKTKVQSIPLE